MLRTLRSSQADGAYITIEGKRLLNLSSNDYLGVAARGDLDEDLATRLTSLGAAGSTSSRLMTGNFAEYTLLEEALARAFRRESALVFGSGYHMNIGIVPALVSPDSVILADRLVHASMIDGIKLSGVRFERFRHNDIEHLTRLIDKHHEAPQIIVMVESVYSMDGDMADLVALASLKRRYPNVMLYVDEAHAVGVFGSSGLGLAEQTGTIEDIDLLVGTFGKALAGMGGYLICDDVIKQILINRCRSLIYSTALPPLTIAYNRLALERLGSYQAERERLATQAARLRSLLQEAGWHTPSQSHIIPIIIGGAQEATNLAESLQALGYHALPIRPPTVPEGSCRLRLSLTSEIDITAFWQDLSGLLRSIRPQ